MQKVWVAKQVNFDLHDVEETLDNTYEALELLHKIDEMCTIYDSLEGTMQLDRDRVISAYARLENFSAEERPPTFNQSMLVIKKLIDNSDPYRGFIHIEYDN